MRDNVDDWDSDYSRMGKGIGTRREEDGKQKGPRGGGEGEGVRKVRPDQATLERFVVEYE